MPDGHQMTYSGETDDMAEESSQGWLDQVDVDNC